MNEKAKISISWLVTVVFVPIIGLSGLRMITSIDKLGEDVQTIKLDQATQKEQMRQIRVTLKLENY